MFGLVEVLLSAPLLHHAVEAVAVAGEGGQLVEAAPGEDLSVPGDQEVAARPQGLVPAISLASRQPPEVVTAAARPLPVILLRGEGVAVVAVIVVESVPLLIVSLTELMMVATGGSWEVTLMVTKLIATIMIMIMVIVITTVV